MASRKIIDVLSQLEQEMKEINEQLAREYPHGEPVMKLVNAYIEKFAEYQQYKVALQWGDDVAVIESFMENTARGLVRNLLWRGEICLLWDEIRHSRRREVKNKTRAYEQYEAFREFFTKNYGLTQIYDDYYNTLHRFQIHGSEPANYLTNEERSILSDKQVNQLNELYEKLEATSNYISTYLSIMRYPARPDESHLSELLTQHYKVIDQYLNFRKSLGLSEPILKKDLPK